MAEILRLENGADSKGRRNEQVAQSEAECLKCNGKQDDCLFITSLDIGFISAR